MSAGVNDPHDDIDKLCDAMSVLMLALCEAELLELPEESANAANKRLLALQGEDQASIIRAGIQVMARNRMTH